MLNPGIPYSKDHIVSVPVGVHETSPPEAEILDTDKAVGSEQEGQAFMPVTLFGVAPLDPSSKISNPF